VPVCLLFTLPPGCYLLFQFFVFIYRWQKIFACYHIFPVLLSNSFLAFLATAPPLLPAPAFCNNPFASSVSATESFLSVVFSLWLLMVLVKSFFKIGKTNQPHKKNNHKQQTTNHRLLFAECCKNQFSFAHAVTQVLRF